MSLKGVYNSDTVAKALLPCREILNQFIAEKEDEEFSNLLKEDEEFRDNMIGFSEKLESFFEDPLVELSHSSAIENLYLRQVDMLILFFEENKELLELYYNNLPMLLASNEKFLSLKEKEVTKVEDAIKQFKLENFVPKPVSHALIIAPLEPRDVAEELLLCREMLKQSVSNNENNHFFTLIRKNLAFREAMSRIAKQLAPYFQDLDFKENCINVFKKLSPGSIGNLVALFKNNSSFFNVYRDNLSILLEMNDIFKCSLPVKKINLTDSSAKPLVPALEKLKAKPSTPYVPRKSAVQLSPISGLKVVKKG